MDFLGTAEFWVAVSFFLFLCLVAYFGVHKKIAVALDERAAAVAKELAAKVNAEEPGCKLYQLCKASDPDTYVFMERYADQAAVEAHRGTAHFKELGRKMGAFMDGRPNVMVLQEL